MNLKNYKYHFYILSAALCFGGLGLFTQLLSQAGVDPFSVVFWRFVFGVVFSAILLVFVFKQNLAINPQFLRYTFLNSILFVGGITTFILGIYLGTPLAIAVALNYAYPFSVAIFAYLFFKEIPTRKQWVAMVLSFVSVLIILEIWTIKSSSQFNIGEMLELANSFFFAAIITFGKKIQIDTKLHPIKIFFYSTIFAIPALVLLGYGLEYLAHTTILVPRLSFDLNFSSWGYLVGLTIFGGLLPIALIYYAAAKISSNTTSILLVTEQGWAYLIGLLFFGQNLTLTGIAGVIGIVLAVLLV